MSAPEAHKSMNFFISPCPMEWHALVLLLPFHYMYSSSKLFQFLSISISGLCQYGPILRLHFGHDLALNTVWNEWSPKSIYNTLDMNSVLVLKKCSKSTSQIHQYPSPNISYTHAIIQLPIAIVAILFFHLTPIYFFRLPLYHYFT